MSIVHKWMWVAWTSIPGNYFCTAIRKFCMEALCASNATPYDCTHPSPSKRLQVESIWSVYGLMSLRVGSSGILIFDDCCSMR